MTTAGIPVSWRMAIFRRISEWFSLWRGDYDFCGGTAYVSKMELQQLRKKG